jgi:hypothetical protein
MATDQEQKGEISMAYRPSFPWATYLPYPPCCLWATYLPRVLIGHLPIYPKTTYGLHTYLPMGHLGTT